MPFVMKRKGGSFNVEMVFPLKGIPCMLVRHHRAAFSLPPLLGQMSKIQRKKDMKFLHEPFPLLCKYGIPLNCADMRNNLLQELCKLNDNEVIEFNHGNNKPALFLRIPKCYNKYVFNRLLKQNGNFLDKMLQFIPRGTGDTMKTAAAWVIESLFNKYKEEFVLVGIQKGKAIVPDKVMDAATSTAMLEDCNINSTNSQKLFWHLYQFFGHRITVLEMVRSTFLRAQYIPLNVTKFN